jgi:sugar/nucleoside kinase (ribokinase family)
LLVRRWSAGAVAVTVGAHGAVLVTAGRDGAAPAGRNGAVPAAAGPDPVPVPAEPAPDGSDPCGAGDCFAAGLAAALHRGADPLTATRAAVDLAGRFVRDGGATSVHLDSAPEPPAEAGTLTGLLFTTTGS